MASAINPYAAHLGTSDPYRVLPATATRLRAYFDQLGPAGLERSYAPGTWPARIIFCHLADTEIAFAFRLRQALAEPHHVIQPFDQDAWAKPYAAYDVSHALELFSALRGWNVALLDSLPPGAEAKPVTHPERGAMTLRILLENFAGHDLSHLRQLEAIAQQSGTGSGAH